MDNVAADGFAAIFSMIYSLFCCGLYIIPIIISIAFFVLWIWMLIEVIQRDDASFKDENGKLLWILIVILGGWVGGLIYYFLEHRKLK